MDENSVICDVKIKKLEEEHDAGNGTQNINDLPKVILEQIQSFLPIKEAVRTSILSKKWQYLWTSYPKLKFEESSFSSRELFMNSVERVLLLHDHAPIERFHLRCKVLSSAACINRWVTSIVRQNVQDCFLILTKSPKIVMLPHGLFSCNTLVELCLAMRCTLRLPPRIHLPSLKSLTLLFVTFSDNNSVQQLFSSPSLVRLKILFCHLVHPGAISITAPKLKSLMIFNDDGGIWNDSCQVVIRECNLEYVHFCGSFINEYSMSNSSIETAVFSIYEILRDRKVAHFHRLIKILHGMHLVKFLDLSTSTNDLLEAGSKLSSHGLGFPLFNNMKRLSLGKLDVKLLGELLRSTPHLQTLSLIKGLRSSFSREEYDEIFNPVPSCFFSSLGEIKIRLHFSEGELLVVEKLLGCATVMQLLKVYLPRSNVKVEHRRKVKTYARGSENCKIVFYDGIQDAAH